MPFQSILSFNVTQELREVDTDVFDANYDVCVEGLRESVTQILNIPTQEGFEFQQYFSYYKTDFSHDPLVTLPYTPPVPDRRRKLGMTHGNVGTTVSYRVSFVPQALGFTDYDEAVSSVKSDLMDAASRGVLTSVLRSHSLGGANGCPAFTKIQGTPILYISSDYMAEVTHMAWPTSMPTEVPRVRRFKNRTGVLAGTVVGVTAFVIAVVAAVYHKKLFGFEKHPDVVKDEAIQEGNDV